MFFAGDYVVNLNESQTGRDDFVNVVSVQTGGTNGNWKSWHIEPELVSPVNYITFLSLLSLLSN